MLCHMNDIVRNTEISDICVRTVDSDVLVILLSFLSHFLNIRPTLKITVDFGNGKSRRLINVNDMFTSLGTDRCLALPFFHSFTGSDATSSFFRYSKSIWWRSWDSFPKKNELNSIMKKLSWTPSEEVLTESLKLLEDFVSYVFGKKVEDLDEFRYNMFLTSYNKELRELPPSKAALELHVRRAAYLSAWLWGNSLTQFQVPSVEEWGWEICDNHIFIRWKVEDNADDKLDKLTYVCRCPTAKCTSCKCRQLQLNCLNFCLCKRRCIAHSSSQIK